MLVGDLDVPVAEPVICGPDDLGAVRAGDLVLAVGGGGSARETAALLRRAGTAQACAVLVATDEAVREEVVEAARGSGAPAR